MALVLAENQKFKLGYNRYIRNALYLTLAIHVILFYITPTFKFKPYVLREEYFEAIELPELGSEEVLSPPSGNASPTPIS